MAITLHGPAAATVSMDIMVFLRSRRIREPVAMLNISICILICCTVGLDSGCMSCQGGVRGRGIIRRQNLNELMGEGVDRRDVESQ